MDLDKYHELEREFMFNDKKQNMRKFEIKLKDNQEIIQEGNIYKIVEKKDKYPMELKGTHIAGQKYAVGALNFGLSTSSKKYTTFISLVETCKAWNKIDGFKADWSNGRQTKYCIKYIDGDILINDWAHFSEPLHFQSEETALLFLDTFKKEIELVKDLI